MQDPVTTRYTEALFGLARASSSLDSVEGDVRRLAAELDAPDTAAFFFDARISIETRREKIEPLLAGMHELTRNFVHLLFDKRREEVLRELGAAFHRRMLQERGAAEGVVESAHALQGGEVQRLETAMGALLKKQVTLENRVTAELLGGVRVIVENRMIDNSLKGRLEGLKKRMLEAPLPSIQEA